MALDGFLVDVSSNNHPGNEPIDWEAAKAGGCIAAFVKATEGTGYINPWYSTDVVAAAAAGLPVLAYHFLGSPFNPSAEAAFFRSVAGAKARVFDGETLASEADFNEFLAALNFPADEELAYGSASTLASGVRALLWPADYGFKPEEGEECWQYTDSGQVAGMPGDTDLSTWLGTQEQFDVLFGLVPTPVPIPSPQESGFMLPFQCTDNDQVNQAIRWWWGSTRTDTMTEEDQAYMLALYHAPPTSGGCGGSGDLLLYTIMARGKATLRPQFVGAV